MENTTIVTALYNISRETNGDGRKWSDYIAWFRETLQLPIPMVIYIAAEDQELVHQINQYRPSNVATKIIFSDIPYSNYQSIFQSIMERTDYKNRIIDPKRVECVLPMYNVIQYSKFKWLKEIAETNPFESSYIFWMDAGISRFIPKQTYSHIKNKIILPQNKLVIQHNYMLHQYPMNEAYLWDSQCLMCGTMFGGDPEVLKHFADIIDKELETRTSLGWINNEQILLAYLYHTSCKDLFHLIYNDTSKHLCLFEKIYL